MLIYTIGKEDNKKVIMLPGSFCNSKSMAGLYNILKFANGDPESYRPMLEPILEIAPIISDERKI